MDDKRFRISISIIASLFLLAFIRVGIDANPIYSALEPVVTRLDSFASEIALTSNEPAETNKNLSDRIEQLEAENERLRSELGINTQRPTQTAEITRRELTSFRKAVWINQGEEVGVVVGQTVLHQNSLFGIVSETYKTTAKIQTVLDPEFRATVSVDGLRGVTKVQHGSLLLDLIPTKELDRRPVLTDGLDGTVEANVLVGTTDQEVSSESAVFGAYNILLPYQVLDVQFVDVLTGERETE